MPRQRTAVQARARRLLVVAGAGSGKTEVIARRIAWLVSVGGLPKESIVAFTFTERAAEEMKFRIRAQIGRVTPEDDDATLGDMYVGTIHGFCLAWLRALAADDYHNYDVLDDAGRLELIQRGYFQPLGLKRLEDALRSKTSRQIGQYATIDYFLEAYDLLNEYDELNAKLGTESIPVLLGDEWDWCKKAKLLAKSVTARLRPRSRSRPLASTPTNAADGFSTSAPRRLSSCACCDPPGESGRGARDDQTRRRRRGPGCQPRPGQAIRTLVGDQGGLTAVGDHRQAIFAWRGGRVDIMGTLHDELDSGSDGKVVELTDNFRSTQRIIDLANDWARTIGPVGGMSSPDIDHGGRNNRRRCVASRDPLLRRPHNGGGLDRENHRPPGQRFQRRRPRRRRSRARSYLRRHRDPAPFGDRCARILPCPRARRDSSCLSCWTGIFSQPGVQLLVALLARAAGIEVFDGSQYSPKSFPRRLDATLGCTPEPETVIKAACGTLRQAGLPLASGTEKRLLLASQLLHRRIASGTAPTERELGQLRTPELVLSCAGSARRGGSSRRRSTTCCWPRPASRTGTRLGPASRGAAAMLHLGALSTLVRGIETPGWTNAEDFRYQMIALYLWGSQNARTEEAPLLVEPERSRSAPSTPKGARVAGGIPR